MITQLANNPIVAFYVLGGLLLAISVHEFAHAFLADRFGDPTPRLAGRVTLNPLAHLDPLGTLTLILFRFGWGKPVPVNNRYFRNPILDEIQVSLAGPFANLALATLMGLIIRLASSLLPTPLIEFLLVAIQINLVLMVFNLIPIPPLDGSRILRLFVPANVYLFIEQFGLFLLLFIFFLGGGLLTTLFNVTVIPLFQIITGQML